MNQPLPALAAATGESTDLNDRCQRSALLLAELNERLRSGDPSEEVIQRLQSLWVDVPRMESISPELRTALTQIQNGIAAATKAGSSWLVGAAEQLDHLARGRRMTQAYTALE